MDPLSGISSFISLADIALRTSSALIDYINDTKNASADRRSLAEETLTLSNLLERLRHHARNPRLDENWLDQRRDLIRQFSRAYDDIAALKAMRTSSKWSFSKSEVYSLLERVTRLQQYATALLLDEQHSLVERIDQRQQEDFENKRKQEILNWLSPVQIGQVHQSISARAPKGSGEWFVASQKFLDWESHNHQLLWCSGIPGAGKTVIASIVVEYLRRRRETNHININAGIAIVYLRYNDTDQTLENVLKSIIKQLAGERNSNLKLLEELYEHHLYRNTTLSLDEISRVLSSLLNEYPELFLVIDALDECSEDIRWALVDCLREFLPKISLMITSRYLDSIDEELNDFEWLEIKANKADLELFIDHNIEKNKNLRRIVEKSSGIRVDIKNAVVSTAEDMFLLARLHIESLGSAAALSVKHVRKKLQTLPTTLSSTYDDAMSRIEAQEPDQRDLALRALAWVCYALRTLSIHELQHALAVEPGHTQLDSELLVDGTNITALCAGLIVIDPGSNVVNLVHYTAKNYFEQIRTARFPGFHATITTSCATYLAFKELKYADIRKIVQDFPLAGYAAQYMGDHARQNPEETLEASTLQVICRLFSHPDKRKPLLALLDGLDLIKSGFYVAIDGKNSPITKPSEELEQPNSPKVGSLETRSTFSTASTIGWSTETIQNLSDQAYDTDENENEPWTSQTNSSLEITALHLAASMGLVKVASMLLDQVPDIDAVDESGKTALAVAMERGFEKAVEFLVNSGASVDLGSEQGRALFLLVSERDWHKVAEIISNKVMNNRTSDSQASVQLLLAAYSGDDSRVGCMITQKEVDLKDADRIAGLTALFLAVERNHVQVVQSLLDAGVDVESKDSSGQTSLHRATRRRNDVLVNLLLRNGAEVDSRNDEGRTPWSAHVHTRDQKTLGILLRAGANPNTKGHQGVSELYDAATDGNTAVVQYMLESGSDPSIRTQFLWAPLHWAAYYGHVDCVKLLLNYGAELSPVSDQDATPLDLALRANQIAVVDILTRAGSKETRDVVVSTPTRPVGNGEHTDDWSASLPVQGDSGGPQTKLSLAFDKPIPQGLEVGQFIYPSTIKSPKDYIYQISHTLETHSKNMSIRQSKTRADMVEYPLPPEKFNSNEILYDISHVTWNFQTLEIRAGSQSSLPGTINMHRDWTGGWKIHHNHDSEREYLFRTTPDWSKMKDEGCRWMTESGTLLARTSLEGVTPVITFEHGPERQMQDILVACWVAKLWSEALAMQKRGEANS